MHHNRVTPFNHGQSGFRAAARCWKRFVLKAATTSALAWFIFGTGRIQATVIYNMTGLTNPANVYTFGGPGGAALWPANTLVTSQFSGITVTPELYYDGNNGTGDGGCNYTNGNLTCLTNFTTSSGPLQPGQTYAPGLNIVPGFTITFATIQTAAAFSLVIKEGDSDVITANLNGNFVDSVIANTGRNGNFYGFQNEPFNSIVVTTSGSNLALINTLEFGTIPNDPTSVPESGTTALFSLGALALVALFRNR